MYVCMYIYIYIIYTHIHRYIHRYTCMYVCMYICMYVCMYCLHAQTQTHTHGFQIYKMNLEVDNQRVGQYLPHFRVLTETHNVSMCARVGMHVRV